jgi:hypothetical protein
MAVTQVFASQYNTWVPSFEDSNRLLVDFSRNPKDFSLNKYIQVVPVKKTIGYYLKMTLEERMRLLDTKLSNFSWADGDDAPLGKMQTESFGFNQFNCQRFAYPFSLGDMAIEQAAWDISSQHLDIKAQQAMTARTQLVYNVISATNGAIFGSNVSNVTAEKWVNATTANLNIKRSLDTAVNGILKGTGSVVKLNQLQLVMNPATAKAMAESQELVDYLKGSPTALAFVRGETSEGAEQAHALFGLPPVYAGLKIVVEDAVKVTSRKGQATLAQAYVAGDGVAFITARPGGLEGHYGGPSFSTVTVFIYDKDDMSVEVKHDVENRKVNGRVVDTFSPIVTAPISGWYFYNAI